MKTFTVLKDVLVPKKCYFCQKEWHFYCPKCSERIKKIPPICYVCKEKSDGFKIHTDCRQYLDTQSLMLLFPYQKIKKLIKDSKYYRRKDILEELWVYTSKFLLNTLSIKNKDEFIIIPIPMNFWRKSKRWYNHSDILAKHVSISSGIRYNTKILKRVKNTLQQSKLTRSERLSNLDWAFKVNEKYRDILKWKKVILIDDVVSTGVTFLEVIAVMQDIDTQSIDCIAIASDTAFFD